MWWLGLGLLALLLWPAHSLAAIAYVQSNQASWTAGSTIVVGYSGNTTSSNLLTWVGAWGTSKTLSSVSGSVSGAFTCPAGATVTDAGGDTAAICYRENVTGGADSLTATFSGTLAFGSVSAGEYSGAATASSLDQTATGNQTAIGTGTDAITTASKTTTTNGQLILGLVMAVSGPTTINSGTGFTCRQGLFATVCNSTTDTIHEDKIQAAAGAVTVTATNNTAGNNFLSAMATFKASAAAARLRTLLGVGQ